MLRLAAIIRKCMDQWPTGYAVFPPIFRLCLSVFISWPWHLTVMPPQPILLFVYLFRVCPELEKKALESPICCTGSNNVFAMSVATSVRPVFRPVPNTFLSVRKNTKRISMKFAGSNHYHEQYIKWLHFWRNSNRKKGAGYERKFESTSVGFAVMSNRCWRLVNEFTNCTARRRHMSISC